MQKIGLAAVLEMAGFNKGMTQYMGGIGDMETKTGGFADKLRGVGGKLGGFAVTAGKVVAGAAVTGAAAIGGMALGIGKLAIDAAPLEGIGIAFEKNAEQYGVSLDALKAASKGTVADFDLMRGANVALTGAGEDLGKEFGKNLPGLMEIAQAAARATGQDAGFLFDSLVTGVKRSSPMLIDNTGLQIKLGEANEAMAKKLGKSVEDLTAEEKQIALLNATMEAGEKIVKDYGGGQLNAAEKLAKFKTQIKNTKDQIGIAFLPALSGLLGPLGDLAEKYGPQVIEWAEEAGKWLGENLPIAIEKVVAWLENDLPRAIETAKQWIEDTKRTIGEWIEKWNDFRTKVIEIWEQVKAKGEEWRDKIVEVIEAVSSFVENAKTKWEEFRTKVIEIWDAINAKIEEAKTWITERLTAIQTKIDELKGKWEEFRTKLEEIWAAILVKVEEAKIWINERLAAIQTKLEENRQKWDELRIKIEDVWTLILTKIEEAKTAIREKLQLIADKIAEVKLAVLTLMNKAKTAWNTIVNKIEEAKAKLKGPLEKIAGWFDAIAGAIQWAVDQVRALITWIGNLAGVKLPGWVQGLSPPPMAEWFAQIGTAAAFAKQEIAGMMGGPGLTMNMPAMSMPAMAGAGAGGGGPVVNVNFGATTINSGMDQAVFEASVTQVIMSAVRGA